MSGEVPGGTWVLLEHVPLPLPRERRGADAEVVEVLARTYGLAGGRQVDPLDVLVAKAWTVAEFAAESGEAGERARVLEGLLPVMDDRLSGLTHLPTPSRTAAPEG